MVSEDNIEFLREGGRRYIVGTPKSMRKKFEQEILKEDWHSIHDGLEVKIVPWPKSDDNQATFNESDSSSVPWTSFCQHALVRRSEPGAFPSPQTINKSCWKNSASTCPQK